MEEDQYRQNTINQVGGTTIAVTNTVETMNKQMEQNTQKQYVPFVEVGNNKLQGEQSYAKNLVSQWEQKKNDQQKPINQKNDSNKNNQIQVGLSVKEIIRQKELAQKQQKELEEKQRQELDKLKRQNIQQEIKKDQKIVNTEVKQIEKIEVENQGIGLTVKERIQQKEQLKKKEQEEQRKSNSKTSQKKELEVKNQEQENQVQQQIQKGDQLKNNVNVADEVKHIPNTVPTQEQVLSVKERIKLQEQQKDQQEQFKKGQEIKLNAQIGLSVKERIKLQEQQKQQDIQKKAEIQVQGINVKEIVKLQQQQKQDQVVNNKLEQEKKIGKLNDKVQQNVWVQKNEYEKDLINLPQTNIIKTTSQTYDQQASQEIQEQKNKPLFQQIKPQEQLEKSELLFDSIQSSANQDNENKNKYQDVQDQQAQQNIIPQNEIQEIQNNQQNQDNNINYSDYLIKEDQLDDLAKDIQSLRNQIQQEEQFSQQPFSQEKQHIVQVDNHPSKQINDSDYIIREDQMDNLAQDIQNINNQNQQEEQFSKQQFPLQQEQQNIEQVVNQQDDKLNDSDFLIKEDQLENLAQEIEQVNKLAKVESTEINLEQSSFQIINMDNQGQIKTGQTKAFDQNKAALNQLFQKGIDQQQFTQGKAPKDLPQVNQQIENPAILIDQRPQLNQRQKRTQNRLEFD